MMKAKVQIVFMPSVFDARGEVVKKGGDWLGDLLSKPEFGHYTIELKRAD
jgi:hypothetical protein